MRWVRSWAPPLTWAWVLSDDGIVGQFFDGQRSKGYPARLRRNHQRLLIDYPESERLDVALDDVRLGTRVGQAGYYLHLPGGAVFESPQGEQLASLLQGATSLGGPGWLRTLESNLRLAIVSAIMLVLVVTGGVVYGVPWASRHIAHALPPSLERVMGQNALQVLEHAWLEPTALSDARQQQLRQAFEPHLARFAELYPEQQLEVHFYAGSELGANAFALPGGIVIFTDELLQLAEDDDELVAILAHEVGHVVHRHGLRNVVHSSLVVWGVMAMTGDMTAASDLLVTLPALLVTLNYSRNMEQEADEFALQYLPPAGVQPVHFANIMLRLEEHVHKDAGKLDKAADGLPEVLSTHPNTRQRIERFITQEDPVNPP